MHEKINELHLSEKSNFKKLQNQQKSIKNMDTSQLYEYRKRLHDWKSHSPVILFSILDQIGSNRLDPQALAQSKIYKTIRCLALVDLNQHQPSQTLFDIQQYQKVIDKASIVYKRITYMLKTQNPTTPTAPIKVLVTKGQPVQEETTQQHQVTVDLFKNFKEEYGGYVQRLPYLNAIAKQILINLNNWRSNSKKKEKYEIDPEKVKVVAAGLEKEIYIRNFHKDSSKMNYEIDLKTLLQFLRRDRSASVTFKVINGTMSYKQAAQLKSDDWLDEDTRREQQKIQKEKFEAEQIGFYKDLQKREMEDVEGRFCKGCSQNKVYLVDEKQTRRSDEPTTKFFECFNCGDKFRVC